MKKLLLVVMMTGLLVACGEKVQFTSTKNKEIMIEKVYEKQDIASKSEYDEILAKLQKQADGGNKEAQEEIDAWNDVKRKYEVKKMSEPSKESIEEVKKMRAKTGYGW